MEQHQQQIEKLLLVFKIFTKTFDNLATVKKPKKDSMVLIAHKIHQFHFLSMFA